MSVHLMGQVWKRYAAGGGDLLLALAIADHAHDDGTHVYPSVAELAAKTRQSERTVQRQLRAMESAGWLLLENSGKGGRHSTRRYRINPAWVKGDSLSSLNEPKKDDSLTPLEDGKGDDLSPIKHPKRVTSTTERVTSATQKGDTAMSPEPSKNRQRTVKREEPALPPGLSVGTWNDFLSHRKKLRSPMTAEAQKRTLAKLAKLADEGHDPEKIVDRSIVHGWKGVFECDETLKQPPVRLGDHHENRSRIGRQRLSAVDRVYLANQERLHRLGS